MTSSQDELDKVMKNYQEKIPDALNRSFPDRLSKNEAVNRHLKRKQLPSTQLFPSCKI
jgi:hypothetical protein